MRPLNLIVPALALVAACSSPKAAGYSVHGGGVREMWVGNHFADAQIAAAVVTESAVYPHYFVTGTAELNAIGERAIAALTEHMHGRGGLIHLRRGGADVDLYESRLETVLTYLEVGGVDLDGVRVDDGAPGGPGVSGSALLEKLAKPAPTSGEGTSRIGLDFGASGAQND